MSTSNTGCDNRKYAIYARKSKFTAKGESINQQIDRCKLHLSSMNVAEEDIIIFEDEGYSGGNTDRPQFKEMMDMCEDNKIQCVICYKLDRISRSVSDFTNTFNNLEKHNIRFISVSDGLNGTNSPMDKAMIQLVAVFAELERNIIAERIIDNMTELAQKGRWLGGTTPTGYKSVETFGSTNKEGKVHYARKLEIVPEEMELVKRIYKLYLKTESLTAVQAILLNDNIKTKMDNEYSRFAVKVILRNPVYAKADNAVLKFFENKGSTIYADDDAFDGTKGMMVYNKTKQEKNTSHKVKPYNEWIVAIGEHDGVIDGADWVRVQNILDKNKDKNYNRPRSHCALLSGLLRCKCGSIMYPRVAKTYNERGERNFAYACKMMLNSNRQRCNVKRINGNFLDDLVWEQIKALTSDKSELAEQLKKAQGNFESDEQPVLKELEQMKRRLNDNKQKQKNLINFIANNGSKMSPEMSNDANEQYRKLENSNKEISSKIIKLEEVVAQSEQAFANFKDLATRLADFSAALDTQSTFEDKRYAVRQVIEHAEWDGENVKLFFVGNKTVELQDIKDELADYKKAHRKRAKTSSDENTTLGEDGERDTNALPLPEKVCQRYPL